MFLRHNKLKRKPHKFTVPAVESKLSGKKRKTMNSIIAEQWVQEKILLMAGDGSVDGAEDAEDPDAADLDEASANEAEIEAETEFENGTGLEASAVASGSPHQQSYNQAPGSISKPQRKRPSAKQGARDRAVDVNSTHAYDGNQVDRDTSKLAGDTQTAGHKPSAVKLETSSSSITSTPTTTAGDDVDQKNTKLKRKPKPKNRQQNQQPSYSDANQISQQPSVAISIVVDGKPEPTVETNVPPPPASDADAADDENADPAYGKLSDGDDNGVGSVTGESLTPVKGKPKGRGANMRRARGGRRSATQEDLAPSIPSGQSPALAQAELSDNMLAGSNRGAGTDDEWISAPVTKKKAGATTGRGRNWKARERQERLAAEAAAAAGTHHDGLDGTNVSLLDSNGHGVGSPALGDASLRITEGTRARSPPLMPLKPPPSPPAMPRHVASGIALEDIGHRLRQMRDNLNRIRDTIDASMDIAVAASVFEPQRPHPSMVATLESVLEKFESQFDQVFA
eukprot:jgi/Hompol1/5583/HPOL_004557-RA